MIHNAYGAHIKDGKQNTYQKEDMKRILGWVFECIQCSDIITLFDIRRSVLWLDFYSIRINMTLVINSNYNHKYFLLIRETQLDKKILSGLLKGTGMELKHQLYLSMIWDRIDIAEEKIFANGKKY